MRSTSADSVVERSDWTVAFHTFVYFYAKMAHTTGRMPVNGFGFNLCRLTRPANFKRELAVVASAEVPEAHAAMACSTAMRLGVPRDTVERRENAER
jgi:hypothetical protein